MAVLHRHGVDDRLGLTPVRPFAVADQQNARCSAGQRTHRLREPVLREPPTVERLIVAVVAQQTRIAEAEVHGTLSRVLINIAGHRTIVVKGVGVVPVEMAERVDVGQDDDSQGRATDDPPSPLLTRATAASGERKEQEDRQRQEERVAGLPVQARREREDEHQRI